MKPDSLGSRLPNPSARNGSLSMVKSRSARSAGMPLLGGASVPADGTQTRAIRRRTRAATPMPSGYERRAGGAGPVDGGRRLGGGGGVGVGLGGGGVCLGATAGVGVSGAGRGRLLGGGRGLSGRVQRSSRFRSTSALPFSVISQVPLGLPFFSIPRWTIVNRAKQATVSHLGSPLEGRSS